MANIPGWNSDAEAILQQLNKKMHQACQIHPRSKVVSIEEAEKAVRKAFVAGWKAEKELGIKEEK